MHAPKAVALVYGDSLTWESTAYISSYGKPTNLRFVEHDLVGSSPCVWARWLPADLAQYRPAIITIESAANGYQAHFDSCVTDSRGDPTPDGSAAFFAVYTASLRSMFSAAADAGVKIVFYEGPPMLNPTRNADVNRITQIARSLAAHYPGVTIASGPRLAVSECRRLHGPAPLPERRGQRSWMLRRLDRRP